jgi:hypothetical protein
VMVSPAFATFHLMQVEQVIGGVNDDTTAQAIQLRMRASFQNLVQNGRLVVRDSTGANPLILIQPSTSVLNSSAGDRVLLVTSNFVSTTSPAVVPDFYMTNSIPPSYLAAGRLTWEDTVGTVLWAVCWGGTNYTGPITCSTLNDDNGTNGPAFPGPLPSTGTSALLFTNTATALSRSNIVDYIVTPGSATFTNNARNGFLVVGALNPVITGCVRENNNIRITWTTLAGKTNFVQATAGGPGGSYSNNFADLSLPIVGTGSGVVTTNYVDTGVVTNIPVRYYRVRAMP